MTVIGSIYRTPPRYILVVVDMQLSFLGLLDRKGLIVRNVCQQIHDAQTRSNPIIVVNSDGFGSLDPRVEEALGDYPVCYRVEKTAGDGSAAVKAVCDKYPLPIASFRLCGTAADACIYRTAVGLRAAFPQSELEIAVDSCNPSTSNWTGYGVGSMQGTKFTTMWGTPASLPPRLIRGRTLVLVDLQDNFVGNVLGCDDVIAAARREILLAKAAGDAIVRINYATCGATNEHVEALLQGYPHLAEIEKAQEDGSAEVSDECMRRGFGTEVFRACGVYAMACLYSTVAGLAAYYPAGRVEVVRQAIDFSKHAADKFRDEAPDNVHIVNVGGNRILPAA
jgi:hypothetical protein